MHLRIVHLSDPHATAAHRPLLAVSDHLTVRRDMIDAIVVSGDIIQRGNLDAYRDAVADLSALAEIAPVITIPGNHDDLASMAGLPGYEPGIGVHDLGPIRLVSLDSNPGRVNEPELAALDRALAEPPPLGTVLVMHHPPFPRSLPDLIVENFDRSAYLAAVVAGRVRLVLCGHYHQTTAGSIAGVPVWSAPALSYQRFVTLDRDATTGWREAPRETLEFSLIELDPVDFRATTVCLAAGETAITSGRTS